MVENLENAMEELKRADHLLFVSLKYSRTVDVIKSVIERMIEAVDFAIISLLTRYKEDKVIDEVPASPVARALTLKRIDDDEVVQRTIAEYLIWRKIVKAEFTRAQEFRRHVTMGVTIDGGLIEVTIDKIQEYFDLTKEFIFYVKSKVMG